MDELNFEGTTINPALKEDINLLLSPGDVVGVISHQLLLDSVAEQRTRENCDETELAVLNAEKSRLDEVTNLSLGFLNILRIDHLWEMKSLTKLYLNNNNIEKIENLHMLKNLQHLDLSFNRIENIENLEELTNLKELSLYENRISKLHNIEQLNKLELLSLGNNAIQHLNEILQLRRLPSLLSLTLAGNPLAKDERYRRYVSAFLSLHYLDYSLIDDTARQQARQEFAEEITHVELLEMNCAKAVMKKNDEEFGDLKCNDSSSVSLPS